MKTVFIFCVCLLSASSISQTVLSPGVYLTENKLGYITILDGENFEYVEYMNESPYTYRKGLETGRIKSSGCGTRGYIAHAKVKGKYSIISGILSLNFDGGFKRVKTGETICKMELDEKSLHCL